tara:strand:+ start:47 stop:247 length:201 start_codon:yes stop_codon:yes gene_type:complete
MKDREEVKLYETDVEMRTLVDERGILIPGLEKIVHFEDKAGNVIVYPWENLKETVLEWIKVEENEE